MLDRHSSTCWVTEVQDTGRQYLCPHGTCGLAGEQVRHTHNQPNMEGKGTVCEMYCFTQSSLKGLSYGVDIQVETYIK